MILHYAHYSSTSCFFLHTNIPVFQFIITIQFSIFYPANSIWFSKFIYYEENITKRTSSRNKWSIYYCVIFIYFKNSHPSILISPFFIYLSSQFGKFVYLDILHTHPMLTMPVITDRGCKLDYIMVRFVFYYRVPRKLGYVSNGETERELTCTVKRDNILIENDTAPHNYHSREG